MSEVTITFKLTLKFIVKVVLFIIWLVILYLLGSFTYGALVIDRVVKAFQVGLGISIIWLVIGIVGFGYSWIKRKLASS